MKKFNILLKVCCIVCLVVDISFVVIISRYIIKDIDDALENPTTLFVIPLLMLLYILGKIRLGWGFINVLESLKLSSSNTLLEKQIKKRELEIRLDGLKN